MEIRQTDFRARQYGMSFLVVCLYFLDKKQKKLFCRNSLNYPAVRETDFRKKTQSKYSGLI
jgi:hypothetical protein